ncbi:MAG: 30S ribosomal protein S6 [Candidatus Margulisiibacteriota bacterium]|nr:MAG: 30S ribosomal protein S6 [Candidatus Margulisbacteria bacterium GWD2_39_127]OGI03939.1 MAG: 30S ribosomal protein S6 [Candidatus Margulisbacteria bacterium GWF2_38_17]OGI08209.1 MAG: 30S ribosomal protein S6 [Candidatus Margulisbacteria bacterium GWE2_39_32]PZM79681.1 MAG: 30S ribosomal protein S6 [Candidatus Margulisiibacteriota bacterium]HAR61926.1 30S ribosomal protein S6 [Candidatus Margulisiibacteriota bacterium]
MKKYELIVIFHPEMQDEEINKNLEEIQKVIVSKKGEVFGVDKWGIREIATEFDKTNSGFYVLIDFEGDNEILNKLYSSLKVNERVVRYLLTVKVIEKEKVVKASK